MCWQQRLRYCYTHMYTELHNVTLHVWYDFKCYRLYFEANFGPTEKVVSRGETSELNSAFVGSE